MESWSNHTSWRGGRWCWISRVTPLPTLITASYGFLLQWVCGRVACISCCPFYRPGSLPRGYRCHYSPPEYGNQVDHVRLIGRRSDEFWVQEVSRHHVSRSLHYIAGRLIRCLPRPRNLHFPRGTRGQTAKVNDNKAIFTVRGPFARPGHNYYWRKGKRDAERTSLAIRCKQAVNHGLG